PPEPPPPPADPDPRHGGAEPKRRGPPPPPAPPSRVTLLPPRQRLRHRHRPLAVHRPQDRSDLLLPHAPENPRRRRVIQPVDDGRRLLGPHALVDLGDRDAAARGLARRHGPAAALDAPRRLRQRLLERLHRRLARRQRLLAAVELLAALAHGLEQLAEAAALREQVGRDGGLGDRALGARHARPPPGAHDDRLHRQAGKQPHPYPSHGTYLRCLYFAARTSARSQRSSCVSTPMSTSPRRLSMTHPPACRLGSSTSSRSFTSSSEARSAARDPRKKAIRGGGTRSVIRSRSTARLTAARIMPSQISGRSASSCCTTLRATPSASSRSSRS